MRPRRGLTTMTLATLTALGVVTVLVAPALAQTTSPLPNLFQVAADPALVPKFVEPLPVLKLDPDPAVPGIPVALGTTSADPTMPNQLRQDVTVNMCEFTNNVLPFGTGGILTTPATHVWGYRLGACLGQDVLQNDSYIGPVVIAQRGVPTRVTYSNQLGDSTTSKVMAYTESTDLTLMWADPLNRVADGTDAFGNPDPLGFFDPLYGSVVPPDLLSLPWAGQPATDLAPWLPWVDPNAVPLQAPPPEFNYCAKYAPHNPDGTPIEICNGHYMGPIPAAPHLHGGEVPAELDGGPDAWWTGSGIYGHGYYSFGGFADAAAGQAVYTYPNTQEAAPIWFHDHVLGATRLNVYAGIAGAYMIVDPDPAKLGTLAGALDQNSKLAPGLLPLGLDSDGDLTTTLGNDELLVPIVLQDRKFDTAGELLFDAGPLGAGGQGFATSVEHPYWVPEFVGDTIAVNGKVWPKLDVQPKRYRFLFLNGSNARAYELMLVDPRSQTRVNRRGARLTRLNRFAGPPMWVIGNDQGYLDNAVALDPSPNAVGAAGDRLVIMPGERYEIIIDFAAFAGRTLEMRNLAAIPYPFGGPVVPGLDDTIMQFNVVLPVPVGFVDNGYNPDPAAPDFGGPIRVDPIHRLVDVATGAPLVPVDKVRRLSLNEFLDPLGGPIEILMNNTKYTGDSNLSNAPGRPRADFSPVVTQWNLSYYSEQPYEGETEVWEIVNFTADAHPIHPHLVAFQILNREPFDAIAYQGYYDSLFPSGVYEPGAGPPLNYYSSFDPFLGTGLGCAEVAPPRGPMGTDAAGNPCVLGGNPDPAPFSLLPPGQTPTPPAPHEQGWKDVAISYPGEVLRILIRFTPQGPLDTAYAFDPSFGHGYVWHCHIIDHEDNEMMRPYNVQVDPNTPRTFVKSLHY